jgi:hypothetical protein
VDVLGSRAVVDEAAQADERVAVAAGDLDGVFGFPERRAPALDRRSRAAGDRSRSRAGGSGDRLSAMLASGVGDAAVDVVLDVISPATKRRMLLAREGAPVLPSLSVDTPADKRKNLGGGRAERRSRPKARQPQGPDDCFLRRLSIAAMASARANAGAPPPKNANRTSPHQP